MNEIQAKPQRVNRLKQVYYRTSDTLLSTITKYKTFTPREYEVTTDAERRKIEREIERLAEETGVKHADLSFDKAYIESIKALGGTDASSRQALRLRALAEEIEKRAQAKREAERRQELPTGHVDLYRLTKNFLSMFGIHQGDVLTTTGDRPEVGELAVVLWKNSESEGWWAGRVVRWDGGALTVEYDSGQLEYSADEIRQVRRVTTFTREVKEAPKTNHGLVSGTNVTEDNRCYECYGLLPGDKLKLEHTTAPARGELVLFWDGEGWDVGRFIELSEFIFDGPQPEPSAYYEDRTGAKWHMSLAVYDIYRVLTVTRTIDFAKTDQPTDEREQKLKQLRHRLDKLDGDDITNCSAILKLEKQIYDLERDSDHDEWPEYING